MPELHDIIAGQEKKCREILLSIRSESPTLNQRLIHIACEQNCYELVSQLVMQDSANVSFKDAVKREPMHYAAQRGNINIMQLLIDNNASVNVEDEFKNQPINLAVNSALPAKTIELLIQHKADVSYKDGNSLTPIMCLAESGYLEAVRLLIDNKASVNESNKDGYQALHYASTWNNKTDAVARLLLDNQADISTRCERSNMTPLEIAGVRNNRPVMQLLLERGADASDETLSKCPYSDVVSNVKAQRQIYEARKAGMIHDDASPASAAAGGSLDYNPSELAVNVVGESVEKCDLSCFEEG